MNRIVRVVLLRIDWERLHFCKDNKIKYRKHLTVGVILSTILGCIGVAIGHEWMTYGSAGVNAITAIMWIWE